MNNQPFIRAILLSTAITMAAMVAIALFLAGLREVLILSING